MSASRLIPALMLTVLTAACGADDRRIVVPQMQAAERQPIAYSSVEIREVSLPSYAAAEEVMIADPAGVLEKQGDLLWADDPSRAVTLELTRYLTQISGAQVAAEPWPFFDIPAATVEVRVEEMLAHDDGSFRLSGQYFVSADSGRERARLFSLRQAIPGDGKTYNIGAARSQALRSLALKIAREGLR